MCIHGWSSIPGVCAHADDLKKVSNAVTGVALSDHLVEVIFTLFDENGEYRTDMVCLTLSPGSLLPPDTNDVKREGVRYHEA